MNDFEQIEKVLLPWARRQGFTAERLFDSRRGREVLRVNLIDDRRDDVLDVFPFTDEAVVGLDFVSGGIGVCRSYNCLPSNLEKTLEAVNQESESIADYQSGAMP